MIVTPQLLAASSKKPTVRTKRLSFSGLNPNSIKLKGASSILKQSKEEREKKAKALRLNGAV
jgi:hypothetical protein